LRWSNASASACFLLKTSKGFNPNGCALAARVAATAAAKSLSVNACDPSSARAERNFVALSLISLAAAAGRRAVSRSSSAPASFRAARPAAPEWRAYLRRSSILALLFVQRG